MNLSEAILLYQQMCTECRKKRSRLPILGEPPCEKCAVCVAINAMKKELKREIDFHYNFSTVPDSCCL